MKRERILCAMSGGVDSSVAALLLEKKGYEVVGIFMNFWSDYDKKENKNLCCSPKSLISARLVASKLGIKLYTMNFKKIFKEKIVDYYIESYENGKTPNPCAVCNQHIKFGKLLQIAKSLKINKIATGHYARIEKNRKYKLLRGFDLKRDQSYFLWKIKKDILPFVELPIGNLSKKSVRELAKNAGLSSHNKKESRGVCFTGSSNSLFLKKYAKRLISPGNVVDKSSQVIGRHKGLAFYTIGQRSGFKVTRDKWRLSGEDSPPLYIRNLDVKKNQLIVDVDRNIHKSKLKLNDINWLNDKARLKAKDKEGLKCTAQIRYMHKDQPCLVRTHANYLTVVFNKPQRAVTPGQSCVFYKKDILLGGGTIRYDNKEQKQN